MGGCSLRSAPSISAVSCWYDSALDAPKLTPRYSLFLLAGWISRQQLIVVKYLKAENRMLRERLKGRSLRFTDKERALLARKAFGINWRATSLSTIADARTRL